MASGSITETVAVPDTPPLEAVIVNEPGAADVKVVDVPVAGAAEPPEALHAIVAAIGLPDWSFGLAVSVTLSPSEMLCDCGETAMVVRTG
jgi:hypothetical protein